MNPRAVSERAAVSEAVEPTARSSPYACAWCGRAFTPRTTGGHPQHYCGSPCRRACDAAGRRWVAEAMAAGALTVDALCNGYAATRALLPAADSPPQTHPAGQEAVDLLDDLLIALLDQPDDVWAALPDELFYRVDQYLDRTAGPAPGVWTSERRQMERYMASIRSGIFRCHSGCPPFVGVVY